MYPTSWVRRTPPKKFLISTSDSISLDRPWSQEHPRISGFLVGFIYPGLAPFEVALFEISLSHVSQGQTNPDRPTREQGILRCSRVPEVSKDIHTRHCNVQVRPCAAWSKVFIGRIPRSRVGRGGIWIHCGFVGSAEKSATLKLTPWAIITRPFRAQDDYCRRFWLHSAK